MRILHLIPSLGSGGAERQLALLVEHQVRSGHEVHVGAGDEGIWRSTLERSGATIHWIRKGSNHDPLMMLRVAELVRHTNPRLVHTWLRQMDIIGGIAALTLGRAWVLFEQSSEAGYPASWKHWVRKRLARSADAIVSNSRGGDRYWERGIGDAVRRFVVPNAVDFDAIDRAPAGIAVKAIPDDAPVVLFAGRLAEEKNLIVLSEALERVVRRTNAVALLCGEGPHGAEISDWVRKHGLDDRIRLLGFRSDVWSMMKAASVLVSISRFEGLPNVILEAMACGCPLVLSDIPAHRELLDEDSAVFVSPDDAVEVAEAIRAVLAGPETARERARRARSRAELYSVAATVDGFEHVYRTVLSENGSEMVRRS